MIPNATVLPISYIALVGSPNSGKTSLFNSLTGARQKVGNYAGVTVERKEGWLDTPLKNRIRIIDLPGTYSLSAVTMDEEVTREVLIDGLGSQGRPDLILAVADATNLERSLNFVLELKSLGIPILLALNMMDLAGRRGLNLDIKVLEKELGLSVIPIVATRKKSTRVLGEAIDGLVKNWPPPAKKIEPAPGTPRERLLARYREIDRILKSAQKQAVAPHHWTMRLDRIFLHPLWGTLLLYLVLGLVFQAIFNWASYPMEIIETGISWVGDGLGKVLPMGWARSLIVDGMLAGVGSVVIFLPQILFLFFIILILEDSGYMARAAFLMDRHMRRVGLHGRAFIPLLSSFACAIPGIMATRTIENRKDRLVTILISPLMACSARVPVYTLLIAAFIPNQVVWGPFRMQGLVMLGLYIGGAIVAFVVALIIKTLFFRTSKPLFLLEMPTYKWPNFRNVLFGMWERAKVFLVRAGTIILAASILIWVISSYPKAPEPLPEGHTTIEYSLAGKIGKGIEPLIRPLGFDWSIGVGLVTGMVAREVIVSALGTLYAVADAGEGSHFQELISTIRNRWTTATGISLLVFFVFAMQCLSTLAVVRRETNSWVYPVIMFTYLSALAYGTSFLAYRLALAWGLG